MRRGVLSVSGLFWTFSREGRASLRRTVPPRSGSEARGTGECVRLQ